MKNMKVVLVFGVCCLLLFVGCMQRDRVGDLTILASKNISTLEGAQNMGVFEGKDCRTVYPFVPPRMPSQEEALDKAVEAGGGNAMIDAVIYFKPASCVFDDICWEVKGTVIKTRDMLKKSDLRSLTIDKGYVREILSSPDGHEYLALKKKSDIDINNDQKRYDLLLRIR